MFATTYPKIKPLSALSQLYTYRQIDENVKKCWRNERNDKCIDGIL